MSIRVSIPSIFDLLSSHGPVYGSRRATGIPLIVFVLSGFLAFDLRGATLTDDFSTGVDPDRWSTSTNQPLYTFDGTQGDLRIAKPVGGSYTFQTFDIDLRAALAGDFSISVGFRDALIDRIDGVPGNQVQLNVSFGGVYFSVVRSDESPGGDNVHVYISPPGAWYGAQSETGSSGTLRIDRIASTVFGYFNGVLLHSGVFNAAETDRVYFSLQNNGTVDATSVTFDDFSLDAHCIYTQLTTDVSVPRYEDGYTLQIENQIAWSALAIRPYQSDDWRLHLYGQSDPEFCVISPLATSNNGGGIIELVVGDFHHVPVGNTYAWIEPYSVSGSGRAEWDQGHGSLIVNGLGAYEKFEPSDVVDMYDVPFGQGQQVTILLHADSALGALGLLFQNPSNGPYSTDRSAAVALIGYETTFTAPASDIYGLAVLNQYSSNGSYSLQVVDCAPAPFLAQGEIRYVPMLTDRFSIADDVVASWWRGAAVRGSGAGQWMLGAYGQESGNAPPICFGNPLATSSEAEPVNFVIWGPVAPDTMHVFVDHMLSTPITEGVSQWDGGRLMSPCESIFATFAPLEVLKAITVLGFDGDESYEVSFLSSTPDLTLHVFQVEQDSSTPMTRAQALTSLRGSGKLFFPYAPDYFPPFSDEVLVLVVTNEDLSAASFTLSIEPGFHNLHAPGPRVVQGDDAVAVGDADGDGELDLFVANSYEDSRLLLSNGVSFSEAAFPTIPADTGRAATWGDYDADGDADLFVCVSRNGAAEHGPNRLYRNDGAGVFVDVASYSLPDTIGSSSARWLDYDLDGNLDLAVVRLYHGLQLLRNDGSGLFVDETPPGVFPVSRTYDAAWGDYDLDGDQDVYVVVSGTNRLYRNDGGGSFTDVTAPPIDLGDLNHDAEWADLDNDGYPDLHVVGSSSIYGTTHLFRNLDGAGFQEFPSPLPPSAYLYYGTVSGDLDLDGDLDLLTTCRACDSYILRNDGNMAFDLVPVFTWPPTLWTSGAVIADFGSLTRGLDMLLVADSPHDNWFRSAGCDRNWLEVDLQGTVSNRDGFGARIEVTTSQSTKLTRWVTSDGGFTSSGPARAHFGLGNATPDVVEVYWPSGIVQTLTSVTANQRLTIVEAPNPVAVEEPVDPTSSFLQLYPAQPNPSAGPTTIRYMLAHGAPTTLRLYDVAGRLVRVLVDDPRHAAGLHEVVWSGRDGNGRRVATGVYYYCLETANEVRMGQLARIR